MLTNHKTNLIALTGTLMLGSAALADSPTFDDLTLGTSYAVGDTFTSDSIAITISPIEWASGEVHTGGHATVSDALMAAGSGFELNTNNCTARLDFAGSIGTQAAVQLLFGEYGGNVNLAVNGDFRNAANPIDLHGIMVGGCLVEVIAGGFGSDAGRMVVSGSVDDLVIGGQEFAIDMTYNENCDIAFEDLVAGTSFSPSTSLPDEGGAEMRIQPFQWTGGTWYSAGFARVSTANLACGDGQELNTNNCNLVIKPIGGPVTNMAWEFGEYGGNINLAINGDFRNVYDYIALDGMTVGGCVVHVTSGGYGNDCGTVWVEGAVTKLAIGGQEHVVDCFTWDTTVVTPGDVDGDGDVDLNDLLAMLAAWGSNDPAADLNGDGVVNVDDLMILLGEF